MNADEYESLPTKSVHVHMMAGACAGIMEHCVMYSVDSVKTRRQTWTPSGTSNGGIYAEISSMIRQEGILRPFRGISAMVAGAGPAHALYFSCYEYLKEKMSSRSSTQNNLLVYACAGVFATILHDGVMNPAEVVKQRMQMPNSPYRTALSCVRHVYNSEGLKAFYRSYRTTVFMNLPFQSIHFVTYEFTQGITNPKRVYNPTAHVISGGLAGAIAATVTMPLDVCKTLLNTQQGEVRATGMRDAFKLVYRYWGLSGYFRGLSARIVYQMPATAICWSTYEFFKYALYGMQESTSTTSDSEDGPCSVLQSQNQASRSSFQGAGLYFNNKPSTPVLFEVTRS